MESSKIYLATLIKYEAPKEGYGQYDLEYALQLILKSSNLKS
jgi:hypothetical protein